STIDSRIAPIPTSDAKTEEHLQISIMKAVFSERFFDLVLLQSTAQPRLFEKTDFNSDNDITKMLTIPLTVINSSAPIAITNSLIYHWEAKFLLQKEIDFEFVTSNTRRFIYYDNITAMQRCDRQIAN
ncbi:hypothetical protein PFISCL1PPCAC_18589, partial [Pristionchus fissidentatus]